mgnify:CR=1 FL=1
MRTQNHIRVSAKPPVVYISHHMILKNRHSIVHVRAALSVGKPIEEPPERLPLVFRLAHPSVLKVPEILLS